MQFLAKHYEKIILACLLFLFGLSMIYLVVIISSADELKKEDLEIKPRKADWKDMYNIDFKTEDFNFDVAFMRNTQWDEAKSRDNQPFFSDMLIMAPVARCPHCQKFTPLYYFNEVNKCPFCNAELPKPPPPLPPPPPPPPGDMDADGIPDVDEEKLGLNPRDPSDADDDMDGDGFSNLFEFKEGTDLKNPRSRPLLYKRLYISGIRPFELDPVLMKVTAVGEDKNKWDIQINTNGGTRTRFLMLGDSINLESKRRYRIVDVIYDVKMIKDGNVEVQRDESKIVCESEDSDKLRVTMQVGKVAYSPLPKAFLTDIATEKEFGVEMNERFRIGNQLTGVEEYTVRNIDMDKKDVTVIASRNRKGVIGDKPLFKLNKKQSELDGNNPAMQGIPGF